MDTLKIINDTLSKMTKTEYKIALFATSNINDFAFETLEEISKKIGTSTASVIRFCRRLGFEGYKEFQDKLREELKRQSLFHVKH
jgi:DNA-binding MurR/RpiR family transcriptional regulator